MSIVVASAATHVGRVRDHNEDGHFIDADQQIFAVADGMGGHAAGEVASSTAVKRVSEAWSALPLQRQAELYADSGDADARRRLLQSVRQGVVTAHLEIVDLAVANPERQGMGTTFTGFLIAGGDAFFAHAGDSRAYLMRDGISVQLSEDHTILARLRATALDGELDPAAVERYRCVLTNALGLGDATSVATFVVPLYSGDRILLCSDGVYEYFEENELGALISDSPSPARAAQGVVDLAVERGGADNATAVVVKVVEAGVTRVAPERRASDEQALAACRLFADLTARERLRALRIAVQREISAGRELSPVALEDRVAYVVLEGEIVGGDDVSHGPGAVIFPESLVAGAPAPTRKARPGTDVRVLVIRRNDFFELTEDDAELGVKLFAAVAGLVAR